MQVQTVFKAGNSPYVVAIPKALAEEVKFKSGEKVVVEKVNDDAVVIRRAKVKKTGAAAQREFELWLKRFFEENGEALDELAVR
ncbi:MAG: hypothetical protein HY381_00735 [Candidatus Chisholmbacteria bacterium]|nr:hypothetical protein [Candidatus Chisholmbacteria bacterium]